MLQIRLGIALFVTLALCLLPSAARAQRPTIAADAFVDTAGVNTHLHFFTTAYGEWGTVRSRLIELGVRHVRDGLIDTQWPDYYTRFDSLAQAGIKAIFIVAPNQNTELWASYPARMPRSFEGFEAPNELDNTSDPNWVETLRQTLARMSTLRDDPRSAAFPVLGPALTTKEAYDALGDISGWVDAGNLHNYMGGRHPGTPGWQGNYGSIGYNIGLVRPYIGDKPIITTENGYHSNTSHMNAIPEDIAGRYMPRLLMAQYRAGIPRTYIYELIDWDHADGHGLLNGDLSPKPAFRAVKGLLNLLADPGPAFTPQNLGYSVQGGTNVHHMVFQKRDGTYFLALWVEEQAFDNETRQRVSVPPQHVTVTTTTPMRASRLHRWQADGSVSTTTGTLTATSFPLDISDAVTVIELAAPAAAPPSPPTPGPPAPGPPPPPPPGGVGLPGAPGLTATATDRTVQLRWQLSAGGAPTGFVLEASAALDFTNLVRVPIGQVTELTIPNVPVGMYFVRIRAANTAGESAPSNVVPLAVGVPHPPELVPVQISTNPIALSWSPAPGASHYILSAGTAPGASNVAVVPMGGTTRVTAAVPAGVRYYVRVAAVNAVGATRSNEISFAVGGPQQPGTPTLQVQTSGRHVMLSWSPGHGSAPDDYMLAIGSSPGGSNLGVIPVGRSTQISGESPIGGTFFVRVYARNGAGATSSNEISISLP